MAVGTKREIEFHYADLIEFTKGRERESAESQPSTMAARVSRHFRANPP